VQQFKPDVINIALMDLKGRAWRRRDGRRWEYRAINDYDQDWCRVPTAWSCWIEEVSQDHAARCRGLRTDRQSA